MSTLTIHADFLEDLRLHYVAALRAVVPKAKNHPEAHDACVAYFNVMHRFIPQQKRKVVQSKAFRARQLSAEQTVAINQITREIESGADLRPRMSKKIFDAKYSDALFNDWFIHHFHLGTAPDEKDSRFVARSAALLYVLVLDDAVFFIDLLAHGNESWANTELLEILHRECPKTIAEWKLDVVPGSLDPDGDDMTPDQRQAMRRLNYPTQLSDGTVYKPGLVTMSKSGHALDVVFRANDACSAAWAAEQDVRSKAEAIRDLIAARTSAELTELRFTYVLSPRPVVREAQTGMELPLVH